MIRYTANPGSPAVEITVSGFITKAELEESIGALKADLETNGRTRVLEIIEHFTGMEPGALWADITLGLPLAHRIERVAVVADQAWVRAMAGFGRLFTRAEIKIFEPGQLDEARTWIETP